jgi:hypothetical protein
MKTRTLVLALCTFVPTGASVTLVNPTSATRTDIGQRVAQFTAPAPDFASGKPKTVEFDSSKTTHHFATAVLAAAKAGQAPPLRQTVVSYNAVAVAAAAAGMLNPLIASLAMLASSLAVVANARRLRAG